MFVQDGTLQNQDFLQFLSDADFPQIGKRPSTWQACVKTLKDEMTNRGYQSNNLSKHQCD